MSKFQSYLQRFDIAANVTEDELEKTVALLQLYGPTLRRSVRGIDEYEEYCQDSRRQSVSDFINLAVDYDRDADSKRIAERLAEMGHSMQLLSILEDALLLVKEDSARGKRYYEILRARFFDVYNKTNEDAFLSLGISSATYYPDMSEENRASIIAVKEMSIKEYLDHLDSEKETQLRESLYQYDLDAVRKSGIHRLLNPYDLANLYREIHEDESLSKME